MLKKVLMVLFAAILMSILLVSVCNAAVLSIFSDGFEEYALGNLGTQGGWTATDSVTVLRDLSLRKAGFKSIKLYDTSTASSENVTHTFEKLEKGSVSWAVYPAQTNVTFDGYLNSGVNLAARVSLSPAGIFMYTDGTTDINSGVPYTANTWYTVTVDVDIVKGKYNLKIVNSAGTSVLSAYDKALYTAALGTVDNVKLTTNNTETGTFYIDEVKVTVDEAVIKEYFDGYATGNLDGQGNWTAIGTAFQIATTPVKTGTRGLSVTTNGMAVQTAEKQVAPIGNGTLETWIRAEQTTGEMAVQGYSGADKLFEVGFGSNGRFYCLNGQTKQYSEASYSSNTWYRINVIFNGNASVKYCDIYIYDQNETEIYNVMNLPLCDEFDEWYLTAKAQPLDRVKLYTPAVSGTFYVDDLIIPITEFSNIDYFEAYQIGAFNGQGGWTASDGAAVVNTPTLSGNKAIRLYDQSATAVESISRSFAFMKTGQTEWWARAEQVNASMYTVGGQGSTEAYRVSFRPDGKFGYTNGGIQTAMATSYTAEKWYRFELIFDEEEDTYDLYIYDTNGTIVASVRDAAFTSAVAGIDNNKFETDNSSIGTFYVDNMDVAYGGGLQTKEVFDKMDTRFNDGTQYSGIGGEFADFGVASASSKIVNDGFEDYSTGDLNSQGGWMASAGATIIDDMSDVKTGVHSAKLYDSSTSTAENARFVFGKIEKGSISWSINPAQTNQTFYGYLYSGTSLATKITLTLTGVFMYSDGTADINSGVSYSADTWYTITQDVDIPKGKYSLKIEDSTGATILSVYDKAIYTTSIKDIDSVKLTTHSSNTGTFYIDEFCVNAKETVLRDYYERYAAGNLNGQGSWVSTGTAFQVVTSPVRAGARAVSVTANGSAVQTADKQIVPVASGTLESWIRASQVTGEMGIQAYSGTDKLFDAGFENDGKFYYYSGQTKLSSTASYSTDTWYRLVIAFDGNSDKKTYDLKVYNTSQQIVMEADSLSMCETVAGEQLTDKVRINTPLGSAGVFFVDDTVLSLWDDCRLSDYFDGYNTAALNGQNGWDAGSNVSVVTSPVFGGSKSIYITDNSSNSESVTHMVPSMSKGQFEWWARAEQTDKTLYMRGIGNDNSVAWYLSFMSNGLFGYSDSEKHSSLYANATYNAGEWYRFKVIFDTDKDVYHIYIYDKNNTLLYAKRDARMRGNYSSINKIAFVTNSTETGGAFYVDSITVDCVNVDAFFPDAATIAWSMGARSWEGYVAMFEALKDTDPSEAEKYLKKIVSQVNAVLDQRDNITGMPDYKGRCMPTWVYSGDATEAVLSLLDSTGYPTLLVDSTHLASAQSGTAGTDRDSGNNLISVEISAGSTAGTFKMVVLRPEYLATYDNLTMDPASSNYVLTRINGIDQFVTVTDLNSPTALPNRNPAPYVGYLNSIKALCPDQWHILYTAVQAAKLVLNDSEYKDKIYPDDGLKLTYGDIARKYIKAAEDFIAPYENDGWFENHPTIPNAGYYKTPYGYPFWQDGVALPNNKFATMAELLLQLYNATGKSEYYDKVSKMATTLKASFVTKATTNMYYWYYYPQSTPGYIGWAAGSNLSTNTYSYGGYSSWDNYSYGGIDTLFVYHCYSNGIVFNADDKDKFVKMVRDVMVLPDGTYAYSVYGNSTCGYNNAAIYYLDWSEYDLSNKKIYKDVKNVFDQKDHLPNYWYLFASGKLYYLKDNR